MLAQENDDSMPFIHAQLNTRVQSIEAILCNEAVIINKSLMHSVCIWNTVNASAEGFRPYIYYSGQKCHYTVQLESCKLFLINNFQVTKLVLKILTPILGFLPSITATVYTVVVFHVD